MTGPSAETDFSAETDQEIHFYGDWTGGYTAHEAEAEAGDGASCAYGAPEPEAEAEL